MVWRGGACGRDSIGDSAVMGDTRWAGAFGVNVDLVARSHCSVEIIKLEDIQVERMAGLDLMEGAGGMCVGLGGGGDEDAGGLC